MKPALQKLQVILLAYGPWGIFLLSIADSFGVPLPAMMDFMLVGMAAASVREPRYAYFTALLAVIGSLIGNIGLFMAARRGARWLTRREPAPGKRQRFREWFNRYGLLTVFVPAAIPVVPLPLKVFVITAAALRVPLGRFLVVVTIGRLIRFGLDAYLGLELGEEGAKGFLVHNGWTLAAAALGAAGAVFLLARLMDRRKESAA